MAGNLKSIAVKSVDHRPAATMAVSAQDILRIAYYHHHHRRRV
jgi:hypothetical protein